MGFVLTSINQTQNTRLFAYERANQDGTRTMFTVDVNISQIRAYAISLQELPLLCRQFLEGLTEPSVKVTFTELEMAAYARRRAAAADEVQKAKRHRQPSSDRVGWAWRSSGPIPPE